MQKLKQLLLINTSNRLLVRIRLGNRTSRKRNEIVTCSRKRKVEVVVGYFQRFNANSLSLFQRFPRPAEVTTKPRTLCDSRKERRAWSTDRWSMRIPWRESSVNWKPRSTDWNPCYWRRQGIYKYSLLALCAIYAHARAQECYFKNEKSMI